jgi:site-specific DNA-methyltransferase (adenine-specific)
VADEEVEAKRVAAYMRTRFFRFLVLMNKNTQNAAGGVYRLAPSLDFSQDWDDQKLADYFGLNSTQIEFMSELVRPMELDA